MLKLPYTDAAALKSMPAAFGRLCVETSLSRTTATETVPPAAFGRLCVETTCLIFEASLSAPSRLRAAVC